jgi:site-specific recombinase
MQQRRKNQTVDWQAELANFRRIQADSGDVAGLAHVVEQMRRVRGVDGLCDYLDGDSELARALGECVRELLAGAACGLALTDSGIPTDKGFADELFSRLGRRLLADVGRDDDLRTIVRQLFSCDTDYLWLREISVEAWKRFLTLLGVTAESVQGDSEQLASAIRVLGHQIAGLGLHPALTTRMRELHDHDSPFLRLDVNVLAYMASYRNEIEGDEEPLLERTLDTVAACRDVVIEFRREKYRFGTSLRTTAISDRLLLMLDRLEKLLHLTEPVEREFQETVADVLVSLVEAENTRNHVRPHIRRSADVLSLLVVERAAKKGEKYITTTWSEYGKFFVASMGGGLIVAIFALFKVLLDKLDVPLAVDALLFGINYAICFVLIYLTGSALATKQPAMTANTIARLIGKEGAPDKLNAVADLIVRTFRSQFISFAGNLVAALPVALLAAYVYEMIFGVPPIDVTKADALLTSLHPWYSGTIFYAGIAGVFLFSAGLVSGYVDNRSLYRRIPERVRRNAKLQRAFSPAFAESLAAFIDRNLGVITGNVFLGFCLGSAGTIGVILGLPFDIRHIAFGAAHFGMAAEALRGVVAVQIVLETMLGVGLIGLVNFLVSFGLALATAFKARKVTFRDGQALFGLLLGRLIRYPTHFIFPPIGKSEPHAEGEAAPQG